jgi:hypothetical protein
MLPPIALPTEVPTGSVNTRIDNLLAPAQSELRIVSMSTMSPGNAPSTIDARIREQIAKALTLNEMLESITPANSHDEVFSDGPVGNEEW